IAFTRAHPVDFIFNRLCGLTLLYASGLAEPVTSRGGFVPVFVLFVNTLWNYFLHANLKWRLGIAEQLIASPAFHHWHHTRRDHKDHNYATTLPVFDRLFGTFYLPRHWPAEYGTDTAVAPDIRGQFFGVFWKLKKSGESILEQPTSCRPLGHREVISE